MPPLPIIVILALGAYRLTRLVTADTIALPLREALFKWAYTDDPQARQAWRVLHPEAEIPSHVPKGWEFRTWVYDLMTCDQCLGVWWSAAVYCAWRFGLGHEGDVWAGLLTVAAVAGAQSLFAWVADRLEVRNG